MQQHRTAESQAPVVRVRSDGLEFRGLVGLIQPHDRGRGHRPVRCLHEDVEIAAVGRHPPDALVTLGCVRGRRPGIHVGADRGLRPGFGGGAEPEPVRQRRLLHVGEIPLIELTPGPRVPVRGRVGLVSVCLPSLQRELVGHAGQHRALEARRDAVIPVDHLVNQLCLLGVNLISQVSASDLPHRPVASPHLMRQIGPPPRDQLAAGQPEAAWPGPAVAGVSLAPDPRQFPERRVAVHQVGPDSGDALGQALHEPYVLDGNDIELAHADHCARP